MNPHTTVSIRSDLRQNQGIIGKTTKKESLIIRKRDCCFFLPAPSSKDRARGITTFPVANLKSDPLFCSWPDPRRRCHYPWIPQKWCPRPWPHAVHLPPNYRPDMSPHLRHVR